LSGNALACGITGCGLNPAAMLKIILISYIGKNSDVDIGMTVSVRHIFFRYWNKRCQKSDIADIKINVDAHLCFMISFLRETGREREIDRREG
jgi:hypothetical protein